MTTRRFSPTGVTLLFMLAAACLPAYAQTASAADGLRGDLVRALVELDSGFRSEATTAGGAGLYLALGFIHLLMFWFYPRLRANLHFSVFALSMSLLMWIQFLTPEVRNPALAPPPLRVATSSVITVVDLSLLVFLYTAFGARVPRLLWLYAVLRAVSPLLPPSAAGSYLDAALMLFVPVEAVRVMAGAVRRKVDGAWIVGVGVLLFVTAPLGTSLSLAGVPVPWLLRLFRGVNRLGLIVSSSVYLARNFARTNRELEAELVHVRELSERELELQRERAELALQNEQERSRRELVEQELTLAADIQKGLFPEALPAIPGYEIAALTRPARVCGGDYYDVLAVGRLGGDGSAISYLLCVADVAGKGLPASLLMSSMQATLHALAGRTSSLVELASLTNQRLYESTPSNKFVTAVLLEIDPVTGEGSYVNAGHGQCLLVRGDGAAEPLGATGLPLGVMPEETLLALGKGYEAEPLRLSAGDVLALYSDGVPEAFDEQGCEWGEGRLRECLRDSAAGTAREAIDRVISEVDRFVGAAPQHDDITLLVFKRDAPQ